MFGSLRGEGRRERMPRKPREQKITVIVKVVPHPDPERALNLIAGIFLKEYLKEEERMKKNGKR